MKIDINDKTSGIGYDVLDLIKCNFDFLFEGFTGNIEIYINSDDIEKFKIDYYMKIIEFQLDKYSSFEFKVAAEELFKNVFMKSFSVELAANLLECIVSKDFSNEEISELLKELVK